MCEFQSLYFILALDLFLASLVFKNGCCSELLYKVYYGLSILLSAGAPGLDLTASQYLSFYNTYNDKTVILSELKLFSFTHILFLEI
jgi:hypothetical protein